MVDGEAITQVTDCFAFQSGQVVKIKFWPTGPALSFSGAGHLAQQSEGGREDGDCNHKVWWWLITMQCSDNVAVSNGDILIIIVIAGSLWQDLWQELTMNILLRQTRPSSKFFQLTPFYPFLRSNFRDEIMRSPGAAGMMVSPSARPVVIDVNKNLSVSYDPLLCRCIVIAFFVSTE